jgi:uncharacterized membrane protein YedE/YeeE
MVTLERIPTERITAQAREVHFWRTVLTLIAGLLFGTGWLLAKAFTVAAKAFAVVWFALTWCAIAGREGWRSARPAPVQR